MGRGCATRARSTRCSLKNACSLFRVECEGDTRAPQRGRVWFGIRYWMHTHAHVHLGPEMADAYTVAAVAQPSVALAIRHSATEWPASPVVGTQGRVSYDYGRDWIASTTGSHGIRSRVVYVV